MKSRIVRKKAQNGEHYFVIKASNGKVLVWSEMYKTRRGMEGGIKATKEAVLLQIEIEEERDKKGISMTCQ